MISTRPVALSLLLTVAIGTVVQYEYHLIVCKMGHESHSTGSSTAQYKMQSGLLLLHGTPLFHNPTTKGHISYDQAVHSRPDKLAELYI